MAFISFDAIAPGSSVSVYDKNMVDGVELTMVVTKSERDTANKQLKRLKPEIFNPDKLSVLKLPGKGNLSTKILHFKDAIELVMVLPGQAAKEFRRNVADIITRYFAGDASLVSEVQANAQSSHPIAEMARAAVDGAGSKRSGDEVAWDEERSEALVKRVRETAELAGVTHGELRSAVSLAKELYEIQVKSLELKKESWSVDDNGRAKAMSDEDTKRAKEIKHIKDLALAKAEADMIVAQGKAKAKRVAKAAEPYPDVATFLPDDHTTVKKTYTEAYPKYKPKLKKDERNFLNEAQTRARQAFVAEMGRPPLRVREEARIVDMYPSSWNGVVETLAGLHRERVGFGQRSIVQFYGGVHTHN